MAQDVSERLKINRAEFPIKRIEYSFVERRLTYFLDRPKPQVGGIYPLRAGQLVSFDDWLGSVTISSVGEGCVTVDDIEWTRTIREPIWWRVTGPDGQLQHPKVLVRITGLLQGSLKIG